MEEVAAVPPPSAAPFELTREQKVFSFVGVLMAMLLAALDQTIVATAGPTIQKKLSVPAELYPWITTAFLVASTVMVPVWGKLSDLFGRKRVLIVGVSLFLGASVLCGLSQNIEQLIAFRALQGMGSASLFTSAFAVVADLFPPAERGKFSGIIGGVFGLSSIVGPLAGGFITDHFGWHWVFLINLPIGAVALGFIVTRMPPLKRALPYTPRIDLVGALLLAVAVVPVLLALSLGRSERAGATQAGGYGWTSPQILGLFALGVVGTVLFIVQERRVAQPLIDLSLFKGKVFSLGSATTFVFGATFLAPIIFLPLYMVNVVGVSATKAGISTLPLVMGILVGNIGSGQLVSRLGKYKAAMLGGLIILLVGLSVMSFTLTSNASFASVTVKVVLVGLGLGPSIPLYTIAIQNAVPVQQLGSATSVVTFFRQMGSTIGVAIAGTLFAATLGANLGPKMAALSSGVPPEVVAQLRAMGGGGEGPRGGGGATFDTEAVKTRMRSEMATERVLMAKALDGDEQAAAQLAQSPYVDERLKTLLRAGGPRAVVKKSFAAAWGRVEASAGGEQQWAMLAQSHEIPIELARAVAAVPHARIADPAGRTQAFAEIRASLEAAQAAAETRAVAQAKDAVEKAMAEGFDKTAAAMDGFGEAMKEAFTRAVEVTYRFALALAVLALILTMLIPELPLRGRKQAGPPIAE